MEKDIYSSTAAMSPARVVVRSGGRSLWSARRSHRYSKTETSPPSVWPRAVAESTGQYGFHERTYCPETPRREGNINFMHDIASLEDDGKLRQLRNHFVDAKRLEDI